MKWGSWTSKKEQNLKGPGEHTCHLPCLWTEPDLSLDSAEPPGRSQVGDSDAGPGCCGHGKQEDGWPGGK